MRVEGRQAGEVGEDFDGVVSGLFSLCLDFVGLLLQILGQLQRLLVSEQEGARISGTKYNIFPLTPLQLPWTDFCEKCNSSVCRGLR